MALIVCPECKTEVSSKAAKCPKCGNPIKRKQSSPLKLGCLAIIFLFIIAAIIASTDKQSAKKTPIDTGTLVLLDNWKFSADDYGSSVKGTVKNASLKYYKYARINFGVYDRSGAKIGTASDSISGLEPGQSWKFKAAVFQDDAISVQHEFIGGN